MVESDEMSITRRFGMAALEKIMAKCIADEYQVFISYIPGRIRSDNMIHISLEKGSSLGGIHLKTSAMGETVGEAFEKCLANFPANPAGSVWDSARLTYDAPPPRTTADIINDDIPF